MSRDITSLLPTKTRSFTLETDSSLPADATPHKNFLRFSPTARQARHRSPHWRYRSILLSRQLLHYLSRAWVLSWEHSSSSPFNGTCGRERLNAREPAATRMPTASPAGATLEIRSATWRQGPALLTFAGNERHLGIGCGTEAVPGRLDSRSRQNLTQAAIAAETRSPASSRQVSGYLQVIVIDREE